MTLFKATVLTLVEYCSQLWCPVKIGEIRRLESVQRNFTSKINSLTNLTYWERLENLKLFSLERRRERYAILYIYKIFLGLVPNFESERWSFKFKWNPRRGLLCDVPAINTSATAKVRTMVEGSFAVRGPRLFNCIPVKIRSENLSVVSFKRHLDEFLSKVDDKPSFPNYSLQVPSNSLLDRRADWRDNLI